MIYYFHAFNLKNLCNYFYLCKTYSTMATTLLSGSDCNFSGAACETLARLAVDNTVGHEDFLSDAHQNSFVLDLVSAVGSKIAFNAIARQLWRINQYTPYSDAAYAYGQSYANCPTSFLISHTVAPSASVTISNEQQRTLAAFINARVPISEMLEVCPYHILMAFCKWLNAPGQDNSKKVMTLDGSIAYNSRNLLEAAPYAYENAYDELGGRDYLSSAIYHYQLTSLVQNNFAFTATYNSKSIMSGFVLDTVYSAAASDEEKYRLVATLILGVNANNSLRAGYANVANVYSITSNYDGTTFSSAANKSATHLTPALLNAFLEITSNTRIYYNNGIEVLAGRTLTGNKTLITATNLNAQDYFEAYALGEDVAAISRLKSAGYTVKEISQIKNTAGDSIVAFQSVKNFCDAEDTDGNKFSYSDIISSDTGLNLSTPQQFYDRVVVELSSNSKSKINLLTRSPFNLNASQIYSIKSDPSGVVTAFNNATEYIDVCGGNFSYGAVNTAFDVSNATAFYNTYKLSDQNNTQAISSLKTNGQYTISAIKAVAGLATVGITAYKSAGFTFKDVKAGFDVSLNTAQQFYNIFNNDTNFSDASYSVFQKIFILKSVGYDVSGVSSIKNVSNDQVYPDILSYMYTVKGTTGTGENIVILDAALKQNVPAVTGDESFSLADLKTEFKITDAQTAFNVLGLNGTTDPAKDIRKIKYILPSITVSDIKAIKKNRVLVSAFQNPANYTGEMSVTVGTSSLTIAGFTNTEITTGFSSDYKSLLTMSSATSYPNFDYVDATYSSNGANLLSKLVEIASEKNTSDEYEFTNFRALLLSSINETRDNSTENPNITDITLVGNVLKYAVYRLVYISVVAKSGATSGAYAPSTLNGMYSYFNLPSFKNYLASGTKYSDFLKASEYLFYSSDVNMTAPSSTTTTSNGVTTTTTTYRTAKLASAPQTIITSRSYDKKNAAGVSFANYGGINNINVKYALGKIAIGKKLIDNTTTVNALIYDSGLSIPDAISTISSPVKASVLNDNSWPVGTHILLSLNDVVSYVQSNFYDSSKTVAENIDLAKALPYSSETWNLTNIMAGPINNAANKMNLDGLSWKQMIAAGASADALVADLAANVNSVTATDFTSSSGASDFVSQFGVPYNQAIVIANKLNTATTGGRSNNGKWTTSALAGNPYYSKSQRKALFNNNVLVASQVLDNDAFIKLKWTVEELQPIISRLELADLLTATETVLNEFDSNYTSSPNSTFMRMIYDSNPTRIALVKAKYPLISDIAANAIAGLTVYSDIVDATADL